MPGCRRALRWLGSQLLYRRSQGDCPEPMRTSQRNLHHQLLRSGVLIFLNRAMAPCEGASTIARRRSLLGCACPLWVIRVEHDRDETPAYVRFAPKRTNGRSLGKSAKCHKRTNAPQQKHRYSITSSARASSVGGTGRPSVLAVCRLMTSSNLVGACTGSSPGFVPLRIRST